MTIWTQEFDILQQVVGSIAVTVVDFQRDRLAHPAGSLAPLAPASLDPIPEEPALETPGVFYLVMNKHISKGTGAPSMGLAAQVALACEVGNVQVKHLDPFLDHFKIATGWNQTNHP